MNLQEAAKCYGMTEVEILEMMEENRLWWEDEVSKELEKIDAE